MIFDCVFVLMIVILLFSVVTGVEYTVNSIGNDGAKAIADALETNKVLTTLNLRCAWLCLSSDVVD